MSPSPYLTIVRSAEELESQRVELRSRVEALEDELSRLRSAAHELHDTLTWCDPRGCDRHCGSIATRILSWDDDYTYLCDTHAEELLSAGKSSPIKVIDLAVAAPMRNLRSALEENK